MTKSFRTKMIVFIVVGVFVAFGVVGGTVLLAPRKLVSVAGIGKLENVIDIVYKSLSCCGYLEGADFETTITDKATIDSVVKQFSLAKMKWALPAMIAGGTNEEVTFRSAIGDKTVKFRNGKIGNFEFTQQENARSALLKVVKSPNMHFFGSFNVDIDNDFVIIDSYVSYQKFVSTIKDFDSEKAGVDNYFFERSKAVFVNLGEGSSLREFYFTKITQVDNGEYLLKIENKQRNDVFSDDNIPMAALFAIPKNFDTTKLTYEVVQ